MARNGTLDSLRPRGGHLYEPPALTRGHLDRLVGEASAVAAPTVGAAKLFLAVAKAQPFKDGNKRTGIFAANALLLLRNTGLQLTVPYSDDDPQVAQEFSRKLAKTYLRDEDGPVLDALATQGIEPIRHREAPSSLSGEELAKIERLKRIIAARRSTADGGGAG